jgi:outer membrane receptor protein involved in Fe transport
MKFFPQISASVSLSLVGMMSSSMPVLAQSVASLTAVVTDSSKAVLPAAQLQLIQEETHRTYKAASNRSGLASFPALMPGEYQLSVRMAGFAQSVTNVSLVTGDVKEVQVVLAPAGTKTEVIVNGNESGVESTDAAVQTVISQEQVKNLPLNGRTFQNLIALTPGVSRSNGAGLFSFNGQRDNTNYFTVDGVAANTGITQQAGAALGQYGAGQAPSLSAATTTSSLLSLDALQEIKIQSSTYSAEYGRSAGGQIQLTSKGGNNIYHGSLFDYIRNDFFDAWNPYTKFNNAIRKAGLTKPHLRLNDFGGTFGGPIRIPGLYNGKDRSFFFVSYEGLRQKAPASGIFETTSVADRAGLNPVIQSYLALSPPQGPNNFVDQYGVPAYALSYSNPIDTNATSVRFDQNVNSKVSLFGRVAYAPSSSAIRDSTFIGELDTVHQYNYTFTLGSTQAFTSHLVNEVRANYTRSGGSNASTLDTTGGATAPTAAMYAQMFPSQYGATPTNSLFVFGDYAVDSFAFEVGTAQENTFRQVNVIDDVTYLKGHHIFKAGADWRLLSPTAGPSQYSQTVAYYSPADLQSGIATIDIAQSADQVTVHQQDVALFLEDSWHATPRLTVNAGLRWDIDPAPYGVDGQSLYAVQDTTNLSTATLAPAGTALYPTRYNQFQPRLGVAYVASTVPGKETLIRAGFGTFYVPASDTGLQATNFFPHNRAVVNYSQLWYSNPAAPIPATAGPPYPQQNLLAYDPGFVTPRTFQWNVSVQQNLGARRTFTLGYVASAGRNLSRLASYAGSSYGSRFLNLTKYYPVDTSDYDSLQASYVQQLNFGLQVLANYTWGKALDTNSGDTLLTNDPNFISLAGERGPSTFDQRNTANIALDWNLPKLKQGYRVAKAVLNGWAADSIFQAHSGNPLTVTFTKSTLPQGSAVLRPDIVPGQPLYIASATAFGGRKLNAAAFSPAYALIAGNPRLQGNESRGQFTNLGFDELDFTIRREFRIGERVALQYRCEVYNLPNQTSYAPPPTSIGTVSSALKFSSTSAFGIPTGTYSATTQSGGFFGVGGPRSVQMALRLSY